MKVPMPPPSLEDIQAELMGNPELLVKLLSEVPGFGLMPDYLPWDKLHYKTPPPGLTHNHWWFALKTARRLMRRPLPLFDVQGRNFSYALPDKVLEMTEGINRRASGQIAVSEQVTNPATRDRYIVSSLMEE